MWVSMWCVRSACSHLLSPTAPTHVTCTKCVAPLPSIDGFAACGASGSKHQSGLPNQQEHAEASIIAGGSHIGIDEQGRHVLVHVVRGLFKPPGACGRQVQVFVVLACFLGWCRLTCTRFTAAVALRISVECRMKMRI